MIGQRASATIFRVVFRYRKKNDVGAWVPQHGAKLLLAADPTGGDVLAVARLLELGPKPHDGHEFSLLEVHRIEDVQGLVQLASNDYAWTAGTSAIEELAFAHSRIVELKAALEIAERQLRGKEARP